MIIQFVDTLAFSGAAAGAGWTLWSSVAPQWERILRVAAGQPDPVVAPLAQLARAERRIVRRAPVSGLRPSPAGLREAA